MIWSLFTILRQFFFIFPLTSLPCLQLFSDKDSSQLVGEAEKLLQSSAVHDVVLAQYFRQLVTGSDTGQLHIDSLDTLYRQFVTTSVTVVQDTQKVISHVHTLKKIVLMILCTVRPT